jgi:transposase
LNESKTELRASKNAKERKRLRLEMDKVMTIRYAADGERSMQEIAKLVGRAKSAVQRWIEHFREAGGDSLALTHLLKVWRHRNSPMRRMEVLVPLLRATLEDEVDLDEPRGASAWINQVLGAKYGVKMSPARARHWLGHLPRLNRLKRSHLTDVELEHFILKGTELFPMWQKTKLEARLPGVKPNAES